MTLQEIDKIKFDHSELIDKFITLKRQHQDLFYKHQVLDGKYNYLKRRVEDLEKQNSELSTKVTDKESIESDLLHENKNFAGKIESTTPSSNITPNIVHTPKIVSTPKVNRTPKTISTPKTVQKPRILAAKKHKSLIYEVENLFDHQGRKGNRTFLVRWKGFTAKDDTWEKERNLHCPKILDLYKKKHNLQ